MTDFFSELTQYTGRDRRLVEERCKTAAVELAWLWEKYKSDPIAYYRESDLYLFDLSNYQTLLQMNGFHGLFQDALRRHGIKTMLDLGGGIGQYTILAAQNGVKTDFLEIEDSFILKYAKWRFEKYGVKPEILTEKTPLAGRKYDLVMAMDVFEHIADPVPVIKSVAEIATYVWANPEEIPYNFMYPQHISRFDLTPYFEKIERYLWKKRG